MLLKKQDRTTRTNFKKTLNLQLYKNLQIHVPVHRCGVSIFIPAFLKDTGSRLLSGPATFPFLFRNLQIVVYLNLPIALPLFFCILIGCTTASTEKEGVSKTNPDRLQSQIRYATNFTVQQDGNHVLLSVVEPYKGAQELARYRLVAKDDSLKGSYEEVVIRVPVESIVCTSTTHIAPLDMLGVSDKLVGFPSTRYISSETVRRQVEAGTTKELGKDSNLNIEMVLELAPEMLMSYTMNGDQSHLAPLQRAGVPIIMNAEYLEESPLGRAEWIKFIAHFFDKVDEADSIFKQIEYNYNAIKEKAGALEDQPSVLSGVVYGDTWYVPGGNSWAARFFNDAGTNYLWKEDSTTGSLQLSFEAVFDKAQNANFWIGAANFYALAELQGSDDRYRNFEAFKQGQVYTYNARAIENGGNDYFESAYSRPDIVLRDLVKIVHSDVLPDDSLYYFRRLDQ